MLMIYLLPIKRNGGTCHCKCINWTNKVSGFWDLGGLFEDQLG